MWLGRNEQVQAPSPLRQEADRLQEEEIERRAEEERKLRRDLPSARRGWRRLFRRRSTQG